MYELIVASHLGKVIDQGLANPNPFGYTNLFADPLAPFLDGQSRTVRFIVAWSFLCP